MWFTGTSFSACVSAVRCSLWFKINQKLEHSVFMFSVWNSPLHTCVLFAAFREHSFAGAKPQTMISTVLPMMVVIVARWLCSALQLGLTLSEQPEVQKTLILYFEIIRWTSLNLPWRGKTSSYASQQEVVKLELQFILPENIWMAGGQRGSQGKWSSWWTRY